jgi:hypothetical protein
MVRAEVAGTATEVRVQHDSGRSASLRYQYSNNKLRASMRALSALIQEKKELRSRSVLHFKNIPLTASGE